jgi:hypothetical protein
VSAAPRETEAVRGYPHVDCIAASDVAGPESSQRADTAASPSLGMIAAAGLTDQRWV